MANTRPNPTRMELSKIKGKLKTARKGHKLLKDKNDELVKKFLDLVRQNKELREKVEKGLKEVNMNLSMAGSVMQEEVLNTALLIPTAEANVEVGKENVMSVDIPKFKVSTTSKENLFSYGFAFTSGDLDDAIVKLSDTFGDMIKLAEIEKACQLMSMEIEKTRRRVNALEHVIIPNHLDNKRYISMKLDENERSNQVRLIKVKDMVIKGK